MDPLGQPNSLLSIRHDTTEQNTDSLIPWEEFLNMPDDESVATGHDHLFTSPDSSIRDLIQRAQKMALNATPSPFAADYLLRNGHRIDVESEFYHAPNSKCRAYELSWPTELTDPVNKVVHNMVCPLRLHCIQSY